jgi:hypothetical protein
MLVFAQLPQVTVLLCLTGELQDHQQATTAAVALTLRVEMQLNAEPTPSQEPAKPDGWQSLCCTGIGATLQQLMAERKTFVCVCVTASSSVRGAKRRASACLPCKPHLDTESTKPLLTGWFDQ